MTLWILSYFGGLLTILSPCILPVLPFVFSQAERPFGKNGLPLLIGMAFTFAVFATLVVVGGEWVIHANEWGRWVALILLTVFGLTLISPTIAEYITRPFTRLGGKITSEIGQGKSFGKSFFLGIATGLLWAPCAGPILGIILTGAAIKGTNVSTSILLLAYALGAATSLALALFIGGKVYGAMKGYLGADRWVRRILGIAVLAGVTIIALGLDRGVLTRISKVNTDKIERKLISSISPEMMPESRDELLAPEFKGVTHWLNSRPLMMNELRGKVVLIDFWTYSCINCLRTLPYVKGWARKYKDQGLVVIGVHTPEFAFEKIISNVEKATKELGITYPVALDNQYLVWNAYANHYWPAHYFIDRAGYIRHHHFGEGEYEKSEAIIRELLGLSIMQAQEKVRNISDVLSPETYLGSARAENFIGNLQGKVLELNQWGLIGNWAIQDEKALLLKSPGKIIYRFHARDLHLVLGPSQSGRVVSFRVRMDGRLPGNDHGQDVDERGEGTVRDHRLYNLIRQNDTVLKDRLFEIEFDGPVEAFAFTFG